MISSEILRSYSLDSRYNGSEKILYRNFIERGYVKEGRALLIGEIEWGHPGRKTYTYLSETDTIFFTKENDEITASYVNGIRGGRFAENNVEVSINIPTLIRQDTSWFAEMRKRSNIFSLSISKTEFNSIPVYLIEDRDGSKFWVERGTGIELRSINAISNHLIYYSYTMNSITDGDIVRPEI